MIITEENHRRQEKGTGGDSAMFSQARNQGGRIHGIPDDPDVECYNCHKKGHMSNNCWSKGSGKEGQGPRMKMKAGWSHGRRKDCANQAQANGDLKDSAYQIQDSVNTTSQFSTSLTWDDWLADSATTSHISNERRTFIDFTPLASLSITGVGDQSIQSLGWGTVILKCKIGKEVFTHHLQDVLYAPKAVNNLLSVRRLDDAGGEFWVAQGKCELRDKSNQVIGIGRNIWRLYPLDACAEKTPSEQASIAVTGQNSWDLWHRKYRPLSITGLQQLYAKGMVEGFTIEDPTQPF